ADFNNDGLLDYYAIGNGTGNIGTIFFQNQDGTFTKDDTSFTGTNLIDPDVTVLDFNNDGYLDMFICAWDDNAKSRISELLINDAFGHFTAMAQPNLIQKGYGSAVWADVDGDGWLDLLLNGDGGANDEASSDIYRLYKNNGGVLVPKATFNDYRQISVGDGARMVDWNNDGKLDVILSGWSNTKSRQVTMLFTCTDAANFTFVEDPLSSILPGVSESSIETADLNNDGKIDLLITGGNYGSTAGLTPFITGYVLNTTSAVNAKPTAPTGLATENTGTDPIVLTWNAATDDHTPANSLTYNVSLKNTTTGKWLYNPMAVMDGANDGWRKVGGEMGNVGTNKRWELYNLAAGNYEWSVQAIDANFTGGSFATKQTFVVRPTAINTIRLNTNVHIFAAEGKLHIESSNSENLLVSVYSITGKLMSQFNTKVVNSVSLNHGAYLVTLSDGTDVKTQKVIL
ncbi:MAG: T9SS type A sorting domain-containing protein, partial [Bacteroidota bacterium]|nr:T9SS type A sorting domain-containing protein [Bacteroidota bacterium]